MRKIVFIVFVLFLLIGCGTNQNYIYPQRKIVVQIPTTNITTNTEIVMPDYDKAQTVSEEKEMVEEMIERQKAFRKFAKEIMKEEK